MRQPRLKAVKPVTIAIYPRPDRDRTNCYPYGIEGDPGLSVPSGDDRLRGASTFLKTVNAGGSKEDEHRVFQIRCRVNAWAI